MARGLSQEELAEASGLHRTFVSQLERGLKSPSLVSMFSIAEALAIDADALVKLVSHKLSP